MMITVSRATSSSLAARFRGLSISQMLSQTSISSIRQFSKDDGKDSKPSDDDVFGVNFDDGDDNTGPPENLPPLYKRDSATGRVLTGKVQVELSPAHSQILRDSPISNSARIVKRTEEHWKSIQNDKDGIPTALNQMGRRVREQDLGLSTLGRSIQAQAIEEQLEDGTTVGRTDDHFSQSLTPDEFKGFQEYMRKVHDTEIDESDIPTMERTKDRISESTDSAELSLKWLTSRAQREMGDSMDDNPYSDLMPGDLSPTRLVNRKRAKKIPRRLLHHNNVALLKSFLTPTGTIQNRVQTRLGARDQRHVVKLIKRARCLGLLPFVGQFKVEDHGWVHAKDISTQRPWEKELRRRGLVVKKQRQLQKS